MYQGIFICFLCLAFVGTANSQETTSAPSESYDYSDLPQLEDTLSVYAYGVFRDTNATRRFVACKELILRLKTALQVENSFDYPFSRLETMSVQYPADSSFRIFTWELYVDKDDYRYYGAIQLNSPTLQLIPLIDRSFEMADINQTVTTSNNWYGAVYYNIFEVKNTKEPYYLLFGYDGFEFFRKRKIVDVLSFKDGKATFGKPIFLTQFPNGMIQPQKRLYAEYSAEAGTRYNYDPVMEMIVFDHLIEQEGPHGEGVVRYPDGSYEAYALQKDGTWKHIIKVFDQVSDEPPRPFPILDNNGSDKDLFGRKRKKND